MRPAALGKGIAAPPLAREKSNFLSPATPEPAARSRKWRNSPQRSDVGSKPIWEYRDADTSLIGKSHPARISPERSRQFKGEISFLKP
jgi:hypothetical protein